MKLCIFPGTFNPIHNVHLAMANYVKNVCDFDTILFIPAYKPPHKEFDDEMSNHRLQMVKLAIEGETLFNISNIEFQNERYSYTYLTILELYKRYNIDGKISMIIGSDAFREVTEWHEADKLKSLVHFIVFARENEIPKDRLMSLHSKGYSFSVAKMNFINLSSTMLRERLINKTAVGSFLPVQVLEYIRKNGLYKE